MSSTASSPIASRPLWSHAPLPRGPASCSTRRCPVLHRANTVRACAEDLALDGTANRACERRRIWVDNACPESSVAGAAVLTARLGRGRGGSVVRSDRPGRVTGRLLDGDGSPIMGAEVWPPTRATVAGAPTVVAATGRTGPAGRYSLRLPPGPSRRVFVHHAVGDVVLARHDVDRLASRARPTLRASFPSAGSRTAIGSASPAGSGPECRRRVVKLQAKVGPHRWQVFRTDRTDRLSVQRPLRAARDDADDPLPLPRAGPGQGDYPYERGHSAVVTRRVTARVRRFADPHSASR